MREIFERKSAAFLIYRLLFPKRNGRVIAISQAVKHYLPPTIQLKTTVLYNGVLCMSTPKHYTVDDTLKLLYLGRIVPWKGCHTLIEIVSLLKKQFSSTGISLTLVGDTYYWTDDYRKTLEQKIDSNKLSSCCHLLPYTEDPTAVFLAHDIFCNASENEPFGRVVAEAQACGLPVVAFNTGGIPEIVTHNETGFLIPAYDNQRFVEALGMFITYPEGIKKMGIKGRKRMYQDFNRDNQIPRICSFLSDQVSLQKEL
jgi:spore coat protein SA